VLFIKRPKVIHKDKEAYLPLAQNKNLRGRYLKDIPTFPLPLEETQII